MTNILIGLHITTRRWCNLGITNFTMMLRIFFQQRFIGEKTLWQTFGIIQPFDRKDILYVFQFRFKLRQFWWQWPGSLFGYFFRFNADRVDFCSKCFAPGCMAFCATCRDAGQVRKTIQERQTIVFCLETQQIIITKLFKQGVICRQRVEDFRCRERNMQKETNAIIHSPFA